MDPVEDGSCRRRAVRRIRDRDDRPVGLRRAVRGRVRREGVGRAGDRGRLHHPLRGHDRPGEGARGVRRTWWARMSTRQTRKQLEAAVEQFESLGIDEKIPFEIWIDEEGLPRRQRITMDFGDLVPGAEDASMEMTVDFSDFGEAGRHRDPDRSEVTDVTDALADAGTGRLRLRRLRLGAPAGPGSPGGRSRRACRRPTGRSGRSRSRAPRRRRSTPAGRPRRRLDRARRRRADEAPPGRSRGPACGSRPRTTAGPRRTPRRVPSRSTIGRVECEQLLISAVLTPRARSSRTTGSESSQSSTPVSENSRSMSRSLPISSGSGSTPGRLDDRGHVALGAPVGADAPRRPGQLVGAEELGLVDAELGRDAVGELPPAGPGDRVVEIEQDGIHATRIGPGAQSAQRPARNASTSAAAVTAPSSGTATTCGADDVEVLEDVVGEEPGPLRIRVRVLEPFGLR